MSEIQKVHPVDEVLPSGKLATLGLQHVLVMYAGAVAVPLIIGRALKLSPEQVAMLISADLFVCGIVTLIQSFGMSRFFGIKLPVMMGVTFAAVGPMVAMANSNPGLAGAQAIFGAIIGAGAISIFLAPFVSRMLRFFPPVVTGTVILVIGISLMRVGINWIFGVPVGPTAPSVVNPDHLAWLKQIGSLASVSGGAIPEVPKGLAIAASVPNPKYAPLFNIGMSAFVLVAILVIAKLSKGFFGNIAVLCGIVLGGIIATLLGAMTFDKVGSAKWFDLVTPFSFGMPTFDPIMIATMVMVMIVVMIESTGMFLALGDITGRPVNRNDLTKGLRVDGLGTFIGGIFNTFPYTSFSQNVGLVGVTGVRSRFVCVAAGLILVVMGLIPKLSAIVEALPQFILGGAGLVMFGMVAATGIRILGGVDYKTNKNNLFVVAVSVGFGMIPLIAPNFKQWMPHSIHPLIESGILLAAVMAVILNAFFNGVKSDEQAKKDASENTHGSE